MGIGQVNGAGRKAVFLDRDGVLNRAIVREGKPYPPATLADLEIMPGAPEALAALKELGFVLIVVTNQPDIARGTQGLDSIQAINDAIASRLPIDATYVCPHDDADECDCRKPKPGLLLRAAAERSIDLRASFMIGDRWRDIEAGRNAGSSTIFIDYGYREKHPDPAADFTVKTIGEAAGVILGRPVPIGG